ncbi:hypothetical protein JTE90_024285 [Oedothorax gibbosus]|uniref:Uncharacterized protein n=1 Tax=Oedothorax gibbosus TaxID=931172 RepID=A0AAV6VXT0_9ARAC|nr:hypothetical protein JTE90_024285 [Oedothorax gibbosus]
MFITRKPDFKLVAKPLEQQLDNLSAKLRVKLLHKLHGEVVGPTSDQPSRMLQRSTPECVGFDSTCQCRNCRNNSIEDMMLEWAQEWSPLEQMPRTFNWGTYLLDEP